MRIKWIRISISFTVLFLVACGGGTSLQQTTKPLATKTVTQTQDSRITDADSLIAIMESQGLHPVLDRSATLIGSDSDSNGIRDDIDRFIASAQLTSGQHVWTQAMARSLQDIQKASLNAGTAAELSQSSALIDACFMAAFTRDEAFVMFKRLEAYTANTRTRAVQYDQYNAYRHGEVGRLLSNPVCEVGV